MAGNSICHLLVRVKDLSPSYPSTSNHNDNSNYHKNTALSLFYIKPQLLVVAYITKDIVFYLFSTSNHNRNPKEEYHLILSFISFLHQTTTPRGYPHVIQHCLLSLFYIKPQRVPVSPITRLNCLLSLFYIKPQPVDPLTLASSIVFYLFSTSNHNMNRFFDILELIVFYLFSTSNHNCDVQLLVQ